MLTGIRQKYNWPLLFLMTLNIIFEDTTNVFYV